MASSTRFVGSDDRAADREFLGLELDPSNLAGHFMLTDAMLTPRGTFYGGGGVAVAVAMIEAATDRRALWTTLQFVSTAPPGSRLDCTADVRAHGHRTSQVRVTAFLDGTEVFTAVGATGTTRPDVTGTIERMPIVPAPDDCPEAELPIPFDLGRSHFATTEYRAAGTAEDLRERGSQYAFWSRVEGMPVSPAMLGYVGDLAPLGVFRAMARPHPHATSLDNTLRVGPYVDTEWALLDIRVHSASDGYAHGTVNLWAPDGTLLGMVSQTMVLRSEI
jgi:acyl-CoA thioesterase